MNEIYKKMKAKGLDMSWYEKSKSIKQGPEQAPLTDDHCGVLSIYLLKKSGRLFTTTTDGSEYMEVRHTKPRIEDCYICMSCKKTFKTYAQACMHLSKEKLPFGS